MTTCQLSSDQVPYAIAIDFFPQLLPTTKFVASFETLKKSKETELEFWVSEAFKFTFPGLYWF